MAAEETFNLARATDQHKPRPSTYNNMSKSELSSTADEAACAGLSPAKRAQYLRAHEKVRKLSEEIREQLHQIKQERKTAASEGEAFQQSVGTELLTLRQEIQAMKLKIDKNYQLLRVKDEETQSLQELTTRLEMTIHQLTSVVRPACCIEQCTLI